MSLQGHRSDLNPAPLRLAAVSFVVDEVLGGIDSAVAELRAGKLTKAFLIDKLKPYKDDPVMLENEAYFLWSNSDLGVFGTKNGRSDLIKAVLAQVNQIRSNELEAISPCNAVAVEDGTLVSISINRKKKRKLNIEDYGTKEQLSLLENLRLQRK